MANEIQAVEAALASLEQRCERDTAEIQAAINNLESIDQRTLMNRKGCPYLYVPERKKIALSVWEAIQHLKRVVEEAPR